jgi:hypothetical protein
MKIQKGRAKLSSEEILKNSGGQGIVPDGERMVGNKGKTRTYVHEASQTPIVEHQPEGPGKSKTVKHVASGQFGNPTVNTVYFDEAKYEKERDEE